MLSPRPEKSWMALACPAGTVFRSPFELGAVPGPMMLTAGLQATDPPTLVRSVQLENWLEQAFGQGIGVKVAVGVFVGVRVAV